MTDRCKKTALYEHQTDTYFKKEILYCVKKSEVKQTI